MEVISVDNSRVQYEGVFDDQKFYNFAKDTLQSQGYSVTEKAYIQFGNNYHIEWIANKLIDDYVAYRMIINLDYKNLTEATAVKDGKPVKTKSGTVVVQIISDILVDYLDKWSVGLSKLVKPLYDKMNQDTMKQRKETFSNEIQNIKNSLQSHFA